MKNLNKGDYCEKNSTVKVLADLTSTDQGLSTLVFFLDHRATTKDPIPSIKHAFILLSTPKQLSLALHLLQHLLRVMWAAVGGPTNTSVKKQYT